MDGSYKLWRKRSPPGRRRVSDDEDGRRSNPADGREESRAHRDRKLKLRAKAAGHPTLTIVLGCLAVAVLSVIALPIAPGSDSWGWLVWGQEMTHADLDTTAGPSWKPGTAILIAPLSLFGALAPTLWMIVARAGALVAIFLAFRLGKRLAGTGAGVVAALGVVLLATWGHSVAASDSEPLLAALCLGAIDAHLSGRRGRAFLLLFLASLFRTEAWIFLAAYGLALWVKTPRRGVSVVAAGVAVLLLWFGGDWLGSGQLLNSAGRAAKDAPRTATQVLVWIATLLPTPYMLAIVAAVVMAVLGIARARRARTSSPPGSDVVSVDRTALVLTSLAAVWIAIVFLMSRLGYWGDQRFMLPAGAVLAVVAGFGVARVVGAVRSGPSGVVAVAIVVLLAAPFLVRGAFAQASAVRFVARSSDWKVSLRRNVETLGGRSGVLGCGTVATSEVQRTYLAYLLEVPAHRIKLTSNLIPPWGRGRYLVHRSDSWLQPRVARAAVATPGRRTQGSGGWTLISVGCSGSRAM